MRSTLLIASIMLALGGCSDDDGPASDSGADVIITPDSGSDLPATDAGVPQWEQVGLQVSPSGAESEDPTMIWLGDKPAVGYRHASFEAHLNLWDQSSWGATIADPTSGQTLSSLYRSPAFCNDGQTLYMAYAHAGDATANDGTFYDRIFAYRFTEAGGWSIENGGEEISAPWNAGTGIGYDAFEPAIACASGQSPVVGWIETDAAAEEDKDVFVRPLDGSSSPRINAVSELGTGSRAVDVVVAADGTVYVAHFEEAQDASFTTDLVVTSYSGGTLTQLGGVIDQDKDTNNLSAPSLALTATGDLYLAYSADRAGDNTRHVYLTGWQNGQWTELGGGPLTGFGAAHYDSANPDLSIVNGVPTVAWEEADQTTGRFIFVAQLAMGGFTIEGERLNVQAAREALDPTLAYSPSENALYVAFEEMVDGYPQIFVKRRVGGW